MRLVVIRIENTDSRRGGGGKSTHGGFSHGLMRAPDVHRARMQWIRTEATTLLTEPRAGFGP